jgi:hypothetical protein
LKSTDEFTPHSAIGLPVNLFSSAIVFCPKEKPVAKTEVRNNRIGFLSEREKDSGFIKRDKVRLLLFNVYKKTDKDPCSHKIPVVTG